MSKQSSLLLLAFVIFFINAGTSAAFNDPYLVNITINNTENVKIANHNSSSEDGNWIELSGGTPIELPSLLSITYYGINSTDFTTSGGPVSITSSMQNYTEYTIRYPYSTHPDTHPATHPVYTNVTDNEVSLKFFGSGHFADQGVDVYLIELSPTSLRDAFNDITNGDTTGFRNLLDGAVDHTFNSSLNSDGDNASISFGEVDAGSYAVFVLLNSTYPDDLTILSGTVFEVLEYDSTLSAPKKATTEDMVTIGITLDSKAPSVNYTYGLVLVHSDAYQEVEARLEFNGTRDSFNLTVNGVSLIEKYEIAGSGLSNVNKTFVQNSITEFIGDDNGLVMIHDPHNVKSNSFIVPADLRQGKYYIFVGVYSSGERLVAFQQSEISIGPPYREKKGPSGGGGSTGSDENQENIDESAFTRVNFIENQPAAFNFDDGPIISIELTPLGTYGLVTAKVEVLKGPSSGTEGAKMPEGVVYQYLNIYLGSQDWAEGRISDPVINFGIPAGWFRENNIDPSSVTMYRYYEGEYQPLKTSPTGQDGEYYYYSAQTPGFSAFIIAGQPPSTGVTAEVTGTAVGTEGVRAEPAKKGIPGFGILIGVMGILVAVHARRK